MYLENTINEKSPFSCHTFNFLSFYLQGRLILAHLCEEPKGLKTGMSVVRGYVEPESCGTVSEKKLNKFWNLLMCTVIFLLSQCVIHMFRAGVRVKEMKDNSTCPDITRLFTCDHQAKPDFN